MEDGLTPANEGGVGYPAVTSSAEPASGELVRRASSPACPVTGCSRARQVGHLLCGDHWRGLPLPLQRGVWRAWRAVKNRQPSAAEALNRYRSVAEAAIKEAELNDAEDIGGYPV